MSEVKSLQCGRCGGPVGLNALTAPATCPYCGQQASLSERVQRALRQYGTTVSLGLGAIRSERGAVADQAASKLAQGRLIVVLGPVTAAAVIATTLVHGALGDLSPLATLFTWLCALVMPVGIWIIAEYRIRGSRGAPVIPPSAGTVVCPECGAQHTLAATGITDKCGSCGAALLPSRALATRGKRAIDGMLLFERMRRWRGERAEWNARVARSDGRVVDDDRVIRPRVASIFLAGGTTMLVMQLLIWGMRSRTIAGGTVAAAIVGGGMLLVAEWFLDTWRMAPRWTRAARRLQGELGGGKQDVLAWLNSSWAGAVPDSINERGRHHQVVMTRVRDFPVMLYANTSGVTLLLAAWTPGVSDTPDLDPLSGAWRDAAAVREILVELSASDVDVVVARAGLIGFATKNSMSKFRATPEELKGLAPTIRRLADLAVAVGALRVDSVLLEAPGSAGDTDASFHRDPT